ncbi:MAG: MGMT family protein [candidate division WOR-3 bacterium]|nr:MAG: MGMT family protein [candidate division WOR-3 bacterium]
MDRKIEKVFYERVVSIIRTIPSGRIATYGQIADYAGNPRGAREVAYILHSSSESENLPWHRVINSKGKISMKRGRGYELQKKLLEDEGVAFDEEDQVDLGRFRWQP